jgi:hypothetical protein
VTTSECLLLREHSEAGGPTRKVLTWPRLPRTAYREVCDQSDEILAGFSLSDAPRALHRHPGTEITSVHGVILHVIEETAAHSGHLEIARELLDGATRRGTR